MSARPECGITCPHTHGPAEAAGLIGLPEATLRRKAGSRLWPSTKVGRNLRFTDSDLEEIIAACRRRPAQPRRRARSAA